MNNGEMWQTAKKAMGKGSWMELRRMMQLGKALHQEALRPIDHFIFNWDRRALDIKQDFEFVQLGLFLHIQLWVEICTRSLCAEICQKSDVIIILIWSKAVMLNV